MGPLGRGMGRGKEGRADTCMQGGSKLSLPLWTGGPDRKIMKQHGLCHPKCSKCVQNKQSDWSDFIGWSKQAIWLVQLHSLRKGFEKYFRYVALRSCRPMIRDGSPCSFRSYILDLDELSRRLFVSRCSNHEIWKLWTSSIAPGSSISIFFFQLQLPFSNWLAFSDVGTGR